MDKLVCIYIRSRRSSTLSFMEEENFTKKHMYSIVRNRADKFFEVEPLELTELILALL